MTAALTFIMSPLGRKIVGALGILLAFLAAWAFVAHHYEAKGVAKEHGKTVAVQHDLDLCHENTQRLEQALDAQSTAIAVKGAADAKALATATQALAKAHQATGAITAARDAIRAPLPVSAPVAATQGQACPVDALTAARLQEIDRRVLQ